MASAHEWWMLGESREPVGPVSTELLLEGIEERHVAADTLVCEVGGAEWRAIRDTSPFAAAFAEIEGHPPGAGSKKRRSPEPSTIVDPPTPPPEAKGDEPNTIRVSLKRFDETSEKTVVDDAPHWSEPPS